MKLFPHQIQALKATENLNKVAYYLDMGLGKTFVGAEKMKQLGKMVNLVVCQKSKVQDWIDHFVINNYESHFQMIYDCTKWKKDDWVAFAKNPNEPCVMVINYDLLFRRPILKQLQDFTLMLDESSLIQNEKAKRSKFILNMNPSNVILLSGSPVGGKYENLYSQIHLLGWNISRSTYNKQYINWKKINIGGFPVKIVDKENPYKNVDRLKQKMREHGAIFMKTEECFDLPEQNFITVKCPTSKEYRKFKKDSIITVDDVELIGDTTLTKMMYSRMLCGQYSKDKLEAFKDLVESTNDRLIVFYNFKEEVKRLIHIANELERPWAIISGDTKKLAAYENYDDSITFVQYQAGSMGLNLQKANKIIYFTPTQSCEQWMQSLKRVHRIGQERPCFYYQMICENSIEEQIYEALKKGVDFTEKLFIHEVN